MTPRQVLGLNLCGPWPGECLILNVPPGNTTLSTRLPPWSTPPAVKTPVAMILLLFDVADVDISWKCSVPETAARAVAWAVRAAGCAAYRAAGLALAAVSP